MQKLECNKNVAISDIGRLFTKYMGYTTDRVREDYQLMNKTSTPSQVKNLIPQSEAPLKENVRHTVSLDKYQQKCKNQWFTITSPINKNGLKLHKSHQRDQIMLPKNVVISDSPPIVKEECGI